MFCPVDKLMYGMQQRFMRNFLEVRERENLNYHTAHTGGLLMSDCVVLRKSRTSKTRMDVPFNLDYLCLYTVLG